jgi:hypothetical protein
MENSNAHRPIPATEEIIAKLPREVLEAGCTLLNDLFMHYFPAHKLVFSAYVRQRLCRLQGPIQT